MKINKSAAGFGLFLLLFFWGILALISTNKIPRFNLFFLAPSLTVMAAAGGMFFASKKEKPGVLIWMNGFLFFFSLLSAFGAFWMILYGLFPAGASAVGFFRQKINAKTFPFAALLFFLLILAGAFFIDDLAVKLG